MFASYSYRMTRVMLASGRGAEDAAVEGNVRDRFGFKLFPIGFATTTRIYFRFKSFSDDEHLTLNRTIARRTIQNRYFSELKTPPLHRGLSAVFNTIIISLFDVRRRSADVIRTIMSAPFRIHYGRRLHLITTTLV